MLSIRTASMLLLVAFALTITGCKTNPIYNVENAPVIVADDSATMSDIENAIVSAGNRLGWQMKPEKPGLITGRLKSREHLAVVEVSYTKNSYNIRYKDSENLSHEGDNIHKRYNKWVQNLEARINRELNRL